MPLAFARTACGSADANRSAQQRAPTNVPPRPGQGTWAPILQPARRSQPGERGTKRAVVRRAGTHHIQTKYNVRHLPTPVPTLVVRLAEAQPWTGHGADRGQQPHSHGCELLWLVRFGQGPGTWVWPRFHWSTTPPKKSSRPLEKRNFVSRCQFCRRILRCASALFGTAGTNFIQLLSPRLSPPLPALAQG